MLQSIMTSKISKNSLVISLVKPLKRPMAFGLFLAVSTAIASPAFAGQKPSWSSSQSLPGLSASQIAGDVEGRFDPLTGRTEYIAADFDPFEENSQITGSARLRSAAGGISRDGVNVSGGAYLDLGVMYAAASRDPYDSKGLQHAVYLNGQPVDVMTYDVQTLDCTRDITHVSYDSGYYSGAGYGYVGGIYRPYPRYRGHSHYYSFIDRIRYGAWRGTRHNYNRYPSYDRRHGDRYRDRNRDRHRDRDRDRHRDRDGTGFVGLVLGERDRDRNRDRNRDRDRDRRGEDRDRTRNLTDAQIGTLRDRLEDRADRHVDQDRRRDPRRVRPDDGVSVTTRTVIRPDMMGDRRLREDRSNRNETRPVKAPVKRPTMRVLQPIKNHVRPAAEPARAETRSARPAPAARPAPRPTRSAPPRSERSSSSNRSDRSRSSRPDKSRSNNSSSRSSSRSRGGNMFGGRTPSRTRDYYPSGSQTQTYVDQRCVKEERLSLHIPAERLDAARFDGLSLALLDNYGNDIPVYIPPNYIEGFVTANPYMRRNTHYPSRPYSGPVYNGYPKSGG